MTQLVRLKKGKTVFEVLTREGSVLKWREGSLSWSSVLESDVVWKDVGRGEQAKEAELEGAFGTKDREAVLKLIVEQGDVQISAAERKAFLEAKKKEIVQYLHKNFVDPKTRLPHPIVRLEQALDNSKFRVDADGPVVRQASDLIKALLGKLSFTKSEMEGVLSLAHQYAGACSGIVHSMAEVKKEDYGAEGVTFHLGISPGDFDAFIAALNKSTKGDYDFKLAGAVEESVPAPQKKGKGKGKKKKK